MINVEVQDIRSRSLGLPVNGGNGGHIILRTDTLCQQAISNLPGEHCWIFTFVLCNCIYYNGSCYFGFRSTDDSCLVASGLVISRRKQIPKPMLVKLLVISHLLMLETEGTLSWSQMPSERSRSLISQANIVGFCFL